MGKYLHQIPRIRRGLETLLEKDPVFSQMDIDIGQFRWPYYGPGFSGLVRIVIGQQISTQAANALWERFEEKLPAVRPAVMLAMKPDDMRALGISHQKADYIWGLAEAVKSGVFNPDALSDLPDETVYETITLLKGFGAWSAQMYLMFCLAREDVWPSGDLGIQEGLRVYHQREVRFSALEAEDEGVKFAHHRTAAALLLWHLKAQSKQPS